MKRFEELPETAEPGENVIVNDQQYVWTGEQWTPVLPGVQHAPWVGSIVHYVSHGTPVREDGTQAFTGECRAAIVTAVQPETVLCVLNPTGIFFHAAEHDLGRAGGTWHWMSDCPVTGAES